MESIRGLDRILYGHSSIFGFPGSGCSAVGSHEPSGYRQRVNIRRGKVSNLMLRVTHRPLSSSFLWIIVRIL